MAFKNAILENAHWTGKDTQAVAMGLSMIQTMEAQYRVQLEMARAREKEQADQAREQIKKHGGTVGKATLETVH